ncbi:MAG: hypothetical protein HY812_01835 [Planctomycetes bacterium]|nr:hypothetical protein [Planctomycetota bacterium]
MRFLPTAALLFALAGCHAPERSDAFFADDPGWSKLGAGGTIGLYAHFIIDQVYIGIAPEEILDFVVGLSTFDLKGDDW